MQKVNTSFMLNVDEDFYPEPNESVFNSLFEQYENVIFSSIIKAFGLDLFIRDQVGGDVDTIHNVRKDIYKNQKNKEEYDNRGNYNSYEYHVGNKNYRSVKHNARKIASENNGVIEDEYTGRNLAFGKSAPNSSHASLEHIIAAKEIHDDQGRVLAGLNGSKLANDPSNLAFTNSSLNSSMHADEIPDYIAKHPELPEDQKERMMAYYNRARKAYEKKLAKEYYLNPKNPNCKRFYFDTGKAAINRGWQMGVREVLGFILTEVWFSIKDELKLAGQKIQEKLSAIISGIKKGFEKAKENYKEIIEKFGQGIISGIVSSLTTTLCNIFFTTAKNLVKIIRQAWASIVEATKIIIFNPDDLWFCDRMTAALKVLATGAGIVIGTSIQEIVRTKLTMINGTIADIISTFSGSLCTGLLTITFLFCIDNNPFDAFLSKCFDGAIQNYKKQAELFEKYCAELQQYNIEEFKKNTEIASELSKQLSNIKDDTELNYVIKNVATSLKISSPWGDGSFDDFMNNQNKKLVFKA